MIEKFMGCSLASDIYINLLTLRDFGGQGHTCLRILNIKLIK